MFEKFSKAVHANFVEMSKRELFIANVEKSFEYYLAAYPKGADPIFRTRTVHDCVCCKQFVRRLGTLVNIVDGKKITVWDNLKVPEPYKTVAAQMGELVRNAPINTVFRTKERKYSVDHNYDKVTNQRYDHFYGEVADRHYSLTPDTKRGEQDAIYQVAKRGLNEIRPSDLDDVLDLIESNGLYKGEDFKAAILGFKGLLTKFKAAGGSDLFVWEHLEDRNCRFRASAIGTLFTDLAEGKDFDQAVKSYESKVAPANYKRPTSIITQKMVEEAQEKLNDLGIGGAIYRRFAKISDISVNNVLFVDRAVRKNMKGGDDLFDLLKSDVKRAATDVKKAVPITEEDFVKTVLPKAESLEVLVENRHTGNFVSLTSADKDDSKIFKWNNSFAWSYEGDVTDSVKQRVKAAGGNVNAKMRVSLSWFNKDDLDLHVLLPNGTHVFYGNKIGILDVDMNAGWGTTRTPVENLAFNDLRDGVYKVYVNQFSKRESIDFGFSIEVEFGGVISQYSYGKVVQGNIPCFNLTVKGGSLVKIEPGPGLVGGNTSQDKWGVKTETLVPVSAVLNSPNHWDGEGVGAKHLIFALKDCKNPEPTRGIYNEFLRGDLDKHRKVFEVLGARSKCKVTDDQISGVGFTKARGDTVTVVVNGGRSYTISF